MYGINGVEKYCLLPNIWDVLLVAFPNDVFTGHLNEIRIDINNVNRPRMLPIPQLIDFTAMCDKHMQDENAKILYQAKYFCNRSGSDSGDLLLIIISEQLVIVNASKMPALTKSSRYENGTNVAKIVMRTPAISAPLTVFPVASVSPNTAGSRPSIANAYCNRGWMTIQIRTTTGNVKTSPNAVN